MQSPSVALVFRKVWKLQRISCFYHILNEQTLHSHLLLWYKPETVVFPWNYKQEFCRFYLPCLLELACLFIFLFTHLKMYIALSVPEWRIVFRACTTEITLVNLCQSAVLFGFSHLVFPQQTKWFQVATILLLLASFSLLELFHSFIFFFSHLPHLSWIFSQPYSSLTSRERFRGEIMSFV